jgi:uroporphyrinogen-III synthase
MRRLLVLRPEPGARATVARARHLGLEAQSIPLFTVEPIAWEAPEPGKFDGLLLTSANAVSHAGGTLNDYRGLQVYAVGEATAEAAREAGFGMASVGKAGVDRLLGSIDAGLRLLHLCGEDRREPEGAKQQITAVPVYRAETVAKPDLDAAAGTVVLIHSRRAGRRLAELVKERDGIAIVAISEAAAAAAGDGWERVETAAEPNDDALLALAAQLCNTPSPS